MSGLEVVAARVPEEARSGCRDRRHRLVAQVLPKVRAVFRGCASTRRGIAYVRVREERAAEGTDEAAQGAQIGRIARELTGVAGCAALASRIAGARHGPASAARRSAARRSVTRGDVVNDVDRRPFASAMSRFRSNGRARLDSVRVRAHLRDVRIEPAVGARALAAVDEHLAVSVEGSGLTAQSRATASARSRREAVARSRIQYTGLVMAV